MAIGSKAPDLTVSAQRTPVAFPCEAIPYLLSTVDALIILSAGLLGCFAYQRGQVEMAEVTVAWLGTALLLAFFAFLFKIGGDLLARRFLDLSGGGANRPSCETKVCQVPDEDGRCARCRRPARCGVVR